MFVSNTAGGRGYQISNSLRLRSVASASLSRTPASAGNRKTWTWSGWVKRGALGAAANYSFFVAGSNTPRDDLRFTNNALQLFFNDAASASIITTQVFRDPSAWYHIVVSVDTTQATAANRVRLYVNGTQVTAFSTANYPAQNYDTFFNWNTPHYLGARNGADYFDGYLSEINFIDGQALTPSSFGQFDANGVWTPKAYAGTYGTNGFYLKFNDGSNLTNLCLDRSGNGNNWTATNVSLTSGVTYDWVVDTPTNNYCTLNLIKNNNAVSLSGANLNWSYSGSGGPFSSYSTMALSGKAYWEVIITTQSLAGLDGVGLGDVDLGIARYAGQDGGSYGYRTDGVLMNNGSNIVTGLPTATVNDVLQFAVDYVGGKLWVGKNGTWFNSGDPANGTSPTATGISFTAHVVPVLSRTNTAGSYSTAYSINFGQRPFAYTPPTGFKALCSANLSAASIPNGKQHFDVVLATGANIKTTAEAVFPSNFLAWIKDRANSNNHQLIDIVRGTSAVLQSNTTAAETTYTAPSGSSVGWLWKAGGAAVTNTAGSITSQVSANTTAGFSIVTYTGTGANATVGHGLGIAPKMVLVKNRSTSTDWVVWHSLLTGAQFLSINNTNATATSAAVWNSTVPTSSVISVGTNIATNGNTNNLVAYCFAEVPGFSRIGSYTGNGSADGPFVFCGFRPRWVMIKRSDIAGGPWAILDTTRDIVNASGYQLEPNTAVAEDDFRSSFPNDLIANGFKIRNTGTRTNANGGTYIFIAFAENPFGGSNVAPVTAR